MGSDDLDWNASKAILTRFDKDLIYDYQIPCPYQVMQLVGVAGLKLANVEFDPKSLKLMSFREMRRHRGASLKGVSERVQQGIGEAFLAEKGYNSTLESCMSCRITFGCEGFIGWGSMYRFRKGEKYKAEHAAFSYFTEDEMREFQKIYDLFLPHVRDIVGPQN